MVGLLFYGYATGVFSSRKLEEATYDSVAFRYIAAPHPDRSARVLKQLKPLFVEILLLADGISEAGTSDVGWDESQGQCLQAALSWGHIQKLEKQLREEVQELMLAEKADAAEEAKEMDLPAELERREIG